MVFEISSLQHLLTIFQELQNSILGTDFLLNGKDKEYRLYHVNVCSPTFLKPGRQLFQISSQDRAAKEERVWRKKQLEINQNDLLAQCVEREVYYY